MSERRPGAQDAVDLTNEYLNSLGQAGPIYRRVWAANLYQMRLATERIARGAYGLEDWADDVRRFLARALQDGVDLLGLATGAPPAPGHVPLVVEEIELGSQSSGPILLPFTTREQLALSCPGLSVADAAEPELILDSSHFLFEPAVTGSDAAARPIVMKVVGLNQPDDDSEEPDAITPGTRLERADYVCFVSGRALNAEPSDRGEVVAVVVLRVTPVEHPLPALRDPRRQTWL